MKPVAWINKTGEYKYLEWNKDVECDDWIPLYTSPQYRELSDEEIREVCKETDIYFDGVDTYRFARAILKKASEK